MTNIFKFFLTILMVLAMGIASAADIVRYNYITKTVKQKDGSVAIQQWKYTYINNKLKAKDMIDQVIKGGPPVITYNSTTATKTQSDGSIIETVTRLTYTDGKLTARDVVGSKMIAPPTPVPVIRYASVTKTVNQPDGSVLQEDWRMTYTNEKLTAKDKLSTTVLIPAPVVIAKVEPAPVVEPTPVVVAPVVEPAPVVVVVAPVVVVEAPVVEPTPVVVAPVVVAPVVVEPAPAPDIRYANVTKYKTLPDGTAVQENWIMTYTNGKLTAKDLINTIVVGTSTVVAAPVAPVVAPIAFDANFNATTYYNNPNMGTPTAVPSFDPNYYLTSEANRTIAAIGANYAYSRGWTGKGSTILVMDTGIDVNNPEFAGKIKYSIDYTKTGIQDTYGHGTQVASIAAAAKDGTGMHGVAYDANLAIAKIGDTGNVSTTSARAALLWAQQYSDIVVANLSANTNYDAGYKASVYQLQDGTYYSKDVNYGGTNYFNLQKPTDWSNVLGKEMVLVVAAGNQGLKYVQAPAVFASAVDANGRLLMNGQMIIAGGWNSTTQTVEGNDAGHICKVSVNEVCQDTYRTSDFFLLAPSVGIESTSINGNTPSVSGTSYSAPAISGAVAIVHQLWPYMKGDQLAQLLLKTANKDIKNYNVNEMGQGLLDLNKATQPVGNLGISVTGRTGTAVPLSGSLNIAGGVDALVSSMLTSVSAVDSFQRDFTVNLSSSANSSTQPVEYMKQTAGQSWSSKFAGPSVNANGLSLSGSGANLSVGVSSQAFSNNYQALQYQATVTHVDHNPWVNFSGMWGQSGGSTTAELSMLYSPAKVGKWVQAGFMNTTGEYKYGMVNNVSDVKSAYAMVGWKNNNVNFYAGVKPTVIGGSVSLTVPTSVDVDGNMNYNNVTSKIRNNEPGFIGASFEYEPKRDHAINFSATYGQDGTGQVGVKYKMAM